MVNTDGIQATSFIAVQLDIIIVTLTTPSSMQHRKRLYSSNATTLLARACAAQTKSTFLKLAGP